MLRLEDHWVWDSWYTRDDEGRYHAFFLRASRALLDPERRHHRAVIGHAISHDLRTWQLTADALVPSDRPGWDDVATWTGSVLRGPDRRWYMFYTGVGSAEKGLVQRIGLAVSDDLTTWHRHGDQPLSEADPTWYERLGEDTWYEEAWRDPWVFADPGGDGWHMLITARANHGPADSRGVLGHARSADLLNWTTQPPLTPPAGFGHLEVPQVTIVDGHPVLLFCTYSLASGHDQPPSHIWTVPGESLTGPWDITAARPFQDPNLYAPRLVSDTDGTAALIGFTDQIDGTFVGELIDPIPVTYTPDTGLTRSREIAATISA